MFIVVAFNVLFLARHGPDFVRARRRQEQRANDDDAARAREQIVTTENQNYENRYQIAIVNQILQNRAASLDSEHDAATDACVT